MLWRRAVKVAASATSSVGMISSMWIMLGMRLSSGPSTIDSMAEKAMVTITARQRFARVWDRFSSK